jgi:hypothetical protein
MSSFSPPSGPRSTRNFQRRAVEQEVIQKILDAVATAPMGLPPSEVEILVLNGFTRVREFAQDMVGVIKTKKWLFSPLVLGMIRPFIGKEAYALMKTFAAPLPDFFSEKMSRGEDWLLYDAPLAMYFHASPTSDPVDFAVAAAYAMLARNHWDGTCMIGTVHRFLRIKQGRYHIWHS